MKKIIIFFTILIVFLSGCTMQTTEVIDYPNFTKGDTLDMVYFDIPPGEQRGQEVEVTLRFPNGEEEGTYTQMLSDETVPIYIKTTLSQKGNYRLHYTTDTFEKYEYFFVGSTPNNVNFEIIESHYISNKLLLKIRNTGKETGELNIVVYDQRSSTSAGRMIYNREYDRETEYIRGGYDIDYECHVNSNKLVVLLNERAISLEL